MRGTYFVVNTGSQHPPFFRFACTLPSTEVIFEPAKIDVEVVQAKACHCQPFQTLARSVTRTLLQTAAMMMTMKLGTMTMGLETMTMGLETMTMTMTVKLGTMTMVMTMTMKMGTMMMMMMMMMTLGTMTMKKTYNLLQFLPHVD
uniref:Uncharacterized protein n=1 Tax=Anopheles gambiae TaxID=7165 RepID=A0A0E4G8L4_ANOGA